MRLGHALLLVLLMLPLASAATPSSAVPVEQDPVLVEWFHGEGHDDVLHWLEAKAEAGEVRLLHWRLSAAQEGSSFPDDDARLRAEAFGIDVGPAVVVDGEPIVDLDLASLQAAVDAVAPRNAWMNWDMSVSVMMVEEGPTVVFDGSVTPLRPLPSGSMVLLALTETSAVDDEGRQARHLVRDMRPEAAFNRTENSTTEVAWYLTPEHLTAAGVDLASSDLGYSVTLLLVDGGTVLEARSIPLPSSVTTHDARTALALLPFTSVVVVILMLFLRSEITTSDALPRLVAAPWKRGEEVVVHVAAASAGCVLTRIDALPPWTVRWSRQVQVPAGTATELRVRPSKGGEAPLHLDIGLDVDGYGGWVQRLSVERED